MSELSSMPCDRLSSAPLLDDIDYPSWHPDIATLTHRVTGWMLGSAVFGLIYAMSSGRRIFLNAGLFGGYAVIVSSGFYTIQQSLFGPNIERYRLEAIAMGLSPCLSQQYPIRWDVISGGITGALTGGILTAQGWRGALAAGGFFAMFAASSRWIHRQCQESILPYLLWRDYSQYALQRRDFNQSQPHVNLDRVAKVNETKPFWSRYLPSWSPVKVWTREEYQDQLKEQASFLELQKQVENKAYSVQLRKKVKEMIEARDKESISVESISNDQ